MSKFRFLLPVVVLTASLMLAACSSNVNPAEATDVNKDTPASPAPVAEEAAVQPEPAPEPAPVKKQPAAKAAAAAPAKPAVPAARVEPVVEPPRVAEAAPAPAPVAVPDVPVAPPAPPQPPPPPQPTTRQVVLPSGTLIAVRTLDAIDSKTDRAGRTFKATVDEEIMFNGQVVIPRGADVELKLTEVRRAGDVRGTSELQLQLDRVNIGSASYAVVSNIHQTEGSSQGNRTVRNAVIGGAIGAAIGAITGGKKGAAIGAGAGAGGGVAAAIITKDQVRIDPETPLVFSLERPLEITVPR